MQSYDSTRPKVELWKSAVCKHDVPALQPGEHMTVGQVRDPAVHTAFAQEFSNWFLAAKSACSKWKRKKLSDCAAPHLLGFASKNLSNQTRSTFKDMLAKALGWDKVTCGQLQALLKSCQPQQALKLLLRNSRSHPDTVPARSQQHKKPRLQQNQDGDGDSDSWSSDSEVDSEPEVDEAWEREHSWFALPRDVAVQGARVGVVPDTDPREALRGQQGLWAAEDLPEGHLLGPYRSYCLYMRQYEHILRQPPPNWKGTKASWRLCLESYACNDDTGEAGSVELEGAASGVYSLTCSGWGFGNETACANDPHLDPLNSLLLPDQPDNYLGPLVTGPDQQELQGCVSIVFAKICGWAHAFMVTIDPVQQGQELLYDYGHSYWVILAKAIEDCNKALAERKREQELQEMKEQLQRVTSTTQASSGLTTSIDATRSINPAATQETSAAAGPTGAHRQPASGADASGAPAESAGGSCAVHGPKAEAGGVGGAAAAPGSSTGVSDMRQQLQGMQLMQQRDGSGGGSGQQAESAAGAVVSESGVVGAACKPACPAEEEDDACSAVLQSMLAFNNRVLDSQQQQKLDSQLQKIQHSRQHLAAGQDMDGTVREVKRVDDPDIVQLIEDAKMKLSELLLKYEHGLKYKKLCGLPWWFNKLDEYYGGKFHFITRHSQLFMLDQPHFTPNTKVMLTPDWREALTDQLRAEGRLPAFLAHQEAGGGAGRSGCHVSGNKRRRHGAVTTITKVIRDDAAEAELRQQLQEAQQQLTSLQQLYGDASRAAEQAQQDVEQLLQLGRAAGMRIPLELLQRQEQRKAAMGGVQQRGTAAGVQGGDPVTHVNSADRSRGRSRDHSMAMAEGQPDHSRQQHNSSRGRSGQNRHQHRAAAPAAAYDDELFDLQSAAVFVGINGGADDDSDSDSPVPEVQGRDDTTDSGVEIDGDEGKPARWADSGAGGRSAARDTRDRQAGFRGRPGHETYTDYGSERAGIEGGHRQGSSYGCSWQQHQQQQQHGSSAGPSGHLGNSTQGQQHNQQVHWQQGTYYNHGHGQYGNRGGHNASRQHWHRGGGRWGGG